MVAWRRENLNWSTIIFVVGYHLALFIALPLYLLWTTPSWTLIGFSIFLLVGSLMSITAGYHRLYSHRTYKVNKVIEGILLFFGTLTVEGSVFQWAYDHRLHHNYVDTEGDPYGTQKGFWHSHLLWMFKNREMTDQRYLADLRQNRMLVFQDRYYGWLIAATNILAILAAWWLTGDLIGAIVFAFLLRMFVGHHCTWFINSLAHMWGSKPYSTEHSAVNNFFLALITYGEGYHNYHHTFAGDYRNGVRWYQFDPSKYMIWTLSKMGLASDLKRTDPLMIKKKLIQADRILLMEHLNQFRDSHAKALAEAVERTSTRLTVTLASAKALRDKYRGLDRSAHNMELKELRAKFREHKQEISRDFKEWRRLCRHVLKLEPVVS